MAFDIQALRGTLRRSWVVYRVNAIQKMLARKIPAAELTSPVALRSILTPNRRVAKH
jgi:hypothetical protein